MAGRSLFEIMVRGLSALQQAQAEARIRATLAAVVVVKVGEILTCFWSVPPQDRDERWSADLESWLQVRDKAFAIFLEASGV